MSVVPHRSGQTESQSIDPSRAVNKKLASNANGKTKGATTSVRAAGVGAWWKSIVGGSATKRTHTAERIAHLADQTKAQTSTAVAASKVGLARAAKIGRENVLPELERTGA